ncbi:Sphingoid long-chain base transporter RSB1 [Hyphodiscus hymeniophilus]|uniref:Sphingoid long-chain base transporter RSB1 n=1 Tax=Hyphodiscus hymeniophilus TaxID=353542 RepID=A0A9P6VE55_9HELO|nr:Sphingoid long-chain base transporter RSB1 [Hyphodiscus hymeniophilus]
MAATVDRNICVSWSNIPGYDGPYGYDPSLGAGISFCILFGMSTFSHIITSVLTRTWWQIVFAVGALTEVIGWAGRTWSSPCPYQTTPFLIQIVTLIIALAPAFFTAGTYVILGRLIRTLGPHISPIGPNTYLYIFCSADILSLVIQAIGGAQAASAYAQTPPSSTKVGTHIMVAGIVFQLASVLVFSTLFFIVVKRAFKGNSEVLKERKIRALIAGTSLSVVCVIIRSVYRTVELSEGWSGYLITHEGYFIGLDGVLMVIAVGIFNFVQPRWAEDSCGHNGHKRAGSEEEMGDRGVPNEDGIDRSG